MGGRVLVRSDQVPTPSGAYSPAIRVGGLLFLAGQGPYDAEGNRIGSTFAEQARQVFANLDAVARAAGGSLADAVRLGVYLRDLSTFDDMDRISREWLRDPLPARTTIQSDLVGFDIEADAVVWLGD